MSSVKLTAIFSLIISLVWRSCWCSTLPAVRKCVIGQGSGYYTCQQMSSTKTMNCTWEYHRLGYTKVIGPRLNLTEDSEIGEYLCRNTINNEIDDIVFVMPAGKNKQALCVQCIAKIISNVAVNLVKVYRSLSH